MAEKAFKIAFLSGPANAPEIYREWSQAAEQVYFGTDYLKQFLQVAADLDAENYVVTWYGINRSVITFGPFTFDNRPITSAGGLRYYLRHLIWHLRLLPTLIRFRPNVLMLTGNQNFWWVLSPLRLFGAKIVASFHAVLWMKFSRPKAAWRLMLALNRSLILRHAEAILVTSNDIRRQVEELLGAYAKRATILDHLPTYSRAQFAGLGAPKRDAGDPFRVAFMGRIVRNKGVFDVIEVARQLDSTRRGEFRFDICGDGADLAAARRQVENLGLQDVVLCHGFCGAKMLGAILQASHAVIVPTRTDCEAGFEMTCAESILAGRPLVTSAVCPALEYLQDASVEAKPDDAVSYREAIVRLRDDAELYEAKQSACAALQEQFYDRSNSWYAAMRRALEEHVLRG